MEESSFIREFRIARLRAVPLMAVQTADPQGTMQEIGEAANGVPRIRWDIVSGLVGINKTGKEAIQAAIGDANPAMQNNPTEMLSRMIALPKDSILFMLNGHRFIGEKTTSEASVGQAIWNLRDRFKQKDQERMLILLGASIRLPRELKNDVLVFDQPLPTVDDIRKQLIEIVLGAGIPKLDVKTLYKAATYLRGLSKFSIEQSIALSLRKDGIDLRTLWERKRMQIEQTPGLSIYQGTETFADLRGVSRLKEFLTRRFNGKNPPTVLVWLDEIEKMFGGIEGDLSGTSQEQHGEFLRWSQDYKVPGIILVGHPGCSKSFTVKCAGGEFGVPVVGLNMTALKGSLVGETGERTREALKTVSAIGEPLMMATSNKLDIIPPELKRRFKLGTYFCDLPTKEERDAVWSLYVSKYKIGGNGKAQSITYPSDEGWTPADIEVCCQQADDMSCSLVEAAEFCVPISKSDPGAIKALREKAAGKWLNASAAGTYQYDEFGIGQNAVRSIRTSEPGEA